MPQSKVPNRSTSSVLADYDEITKILFRDNTPPRPRKTIVEEGKTKNEEISPDSTESTRSLYGSEPTSTHSETILSPSNLQQQKSLTTIHLEDVDVQSPTTLIDGKEISPSIEDKLLLQGLMKNSVDCCDREEWKQENIYPYLCSGALRPYEEACSMFDISPKVWPGWTLTSSPETPLEKNQLVTPDHIGQVDKAIESTPPSSNVLPPTALTPSSKTPDELPEYDTPIRCVDSPLSTSEVSSPTTHFQNIHGGRSPDSYMDPIIETTIPDEEKGNDSLSSIESESSADAVTTLVSNVNVTNINHHKNWERKVEDLERACTSLFDMIRNDSKTIVQLKGEIMLLRKKDKKRLMDFQLHTEFCQLKTDLNTAHYRESRHLETIRLLRKDLDLFVVQSRTVRELQKIREENKVLLKQLIENEEDMRQLQDTLYSVQAENFKLKDEKMMTSFTKKENERFFDDMNDSVESRMALYLRIVTLEERISELEQMQPSSPSVVSVTDYFINKQKQNRRMEDTVDSQLQDDITYTIDGCNDSILMDSTEEMIRHEKNQRGKVIHPTFVDEKFVEEHDDESKTMFDDEVEVTLEGMIITMSHEPEYISLPEVREIRVQQPPPPRPETYQKPKGGKVTTLVRILRGCLPTSRTR